MPTRKRKGRTKRTACALIPRGNISHSKGMGLFVVPPDLIARFAGTRKIAYGGAARLVIVSDRDLKFEANGADWWSVRNAPGDLGKLPARSLHRRAFVLRPSLTPRAGSDVEPPRGWLDIAIRGRLP